jgi:hypothetical protein
MKSVQKVNSFGILLLGFIFGIVEIPCFPQAVAQHDVAWQSTGVPAAGAQVTVCQKTAVNSGTSCTPTATIYTAATGGIAANPATADSKGNYSFFLVPGTYYVAVYNGSTTQYYYLDVPLPSPVSSLAATGVTTNNGISNILAFNNTAQATTITGTATGLTQATLTITDLNPLANALYVVPGHDTNVAAVRIRNTANGADRHLFYGDGRVSLIGGGTGGGITANANFAGYAMTLSNSNAAGTGLSIQPGGNNSDAFRVLNAAGSVVIHSLQGDGDAFFSSSTNGGIFIGKDYTGTTPLIKTFTTAHAAGNVPSEVDIGSNDGGFVGMAIPSVRDGAFNSQSISFYTQHGGTSLGARMSIDKDGNVGIGTTAPIRKLDVAGEIRAQPVANTSVYPFDISTSGSLANQKIAFIGITGTPGFTITQNSGSRIQYTLDNGDTTIGGIEYVKRGTLALVAGANNDIPTPAASYVEITGPAAPFNVSGFTGGGDGRKLTLFNTTGVAMTITNDATSTAANRIYTLTGADVVLRAGNSAASFVYSIGSNRWILVSYN